MPWFSFVFAYASISLLLMHTIVSFAQVNVFLNKQLSEIDVIPGEILERVIKQFEAEDYASDKPVRKTYATVFDIESGVDFHVRS